MKTTATWKDRLRKILERILFWRTQTFSTLCAASDGRAASATLTQMLDGHNLRRKLGYRSINQNSGAVFEMWKEARDTVPVLTTILVLDEEKASLDQLQILSSMQHLLAFGFAYTMKLVCDDNDGRKFDLEDPKEAGIFAKSVAVKLHRVMNESFTGFFSQPLIMSYKYERVVRKRALHSELLDEIFKHFVLPGSDKKVLDSVLTDISKKLADTIEVTDEQMPYCVLFLYFEKIRGTEISLGRIGLMYLNIEKKSWETATRKHGWRIRFKMNVFDESWTVASAQVTTQKQELTTLIEEMAGVPLADVYKLMTPRATVKPETKPENTMR